jgi:glycosyltransferase involved in cell wall biosynthesis
LKIYVVSPYESIDDTNTGVDGPRLRSIQLAKALVREGHKVVLLSKGKYSKILGPQKYESISWSDPYHLKQIISDADVVVTSYAALGLNRLILSYLRPDQFLVADAIVPIFAENASRNTKDVIDESLLLKFLYRANLILISSTNLIKFYNNLMYPNGEIRRQQSSFFVYPYIEPPEVQNFFGEKKDSGLNLVYYGGVYPWFGVDEFVFFLENFPSRSKEVRLTIVGLNNPNISSKEIEECTQRVVNASSKKSNIVFKPWVHSDYRIEYLSKFDMAIFFNQPGSVETQVSWRTRYADFLSAKLPLVVNSSDPFSSHFINHGVGLEIPPETLLNMLESKVSLKKLIIQSQEIKLSKGWGEMTEYLSFESLSRALVESLIQTIESSSKL